jgi:hypothetical protein
MDARAIQEFVRRDWEAVARSKIAYWADRFQREGWRAAWETADALWIEMRRERPDYPTEADRAADGTAHALLRDRLDRAVDAFARR